jgi:hypothetical protein
MPPGPGLYKGYDETVMVGSCDGPRIGPSPMSLLTGNMSRLS